MNDLNAFVEGFIADYSRRFAKSPRQDVDVHRSLGSQKALDTIFT